MEARRDETPAVLRSGEPVVTKLRRIAEKARRDPRFTFTSLYHLMNEELLRECFKRLRKEAAAGIDEVTKEMYAENLDDNLSNLIDRLYRMTYIPQPVRRKYIPKPGSAKQCPLGIPCFEDKLVQAGLVRILESVYEQDFIEDSYGLVVHLAQVRLMTSTFAILSQVVMDSDRTACVSLDGSHKEVWC